MSFFDAYDFWRDPVLAVVISAALCGYLGVYVTLRRVVFVGAALTQVSGAGIALTFWLASYFPSQDPHVAGKHSLLFDPAFWSLVFAVTGALAFSLNRGGRRLSSEAVVGLGWVLAAAALLLILSSKRIVQEAHEVDDLLYGNAVLATAAQVRSLAAVAGGLLAFHLVFYKELVFVTYDPDMAETLGYRTRLWDMLLFATFGTGISFAVRAVGALPAFGFLVVPAAGALLLVRRVAWAFPLAVLFAVCGGALGYYLAWTLEWPTGPAIVGASSIFLVPGLARRLIWRTA